MKPIEFFIAYRFLKEGKSQSLFIFGGAAVGVAVIVFLAALILGLQNSIIERTLGNQPDINIEAPTDAEPTSIYAPTDNEYVFARFEPRPQRVEAIDDWQRLLDDLAADPDVVALSPMAAGSAVAVRGPVAYPLQILGVRPDLHQEIADVEGNLIDGEFRTDDEGAVIGVTLAQDLAAEVGDRIRILDAGGESRSMTVRGIFDLGAGQPNQTWVFTNIRNAQAILGLGDDISRIAVNVDDLFEADAVSARLQGITAMEVRSWQEDNENLLRAIRTQSASTILIGVFVAISVALGIASVLVVTVVQKRGQVGVLRAMGASMGTVQRVFLIQGAAVGLVGSIFGSAAGVGLAIAFTELIRDPAGEAVFPIEPSPTIFVAACLLATLTGLLAAVFPARRAARLDPADAIQNG